MESANHTKVGYNSKSAYNLADPAPKLLLSTEMIKNRRRTQSVWVAEKTKFVENGCLLLASNKSTVALVVKGWSGEEVRYDDA